MLPTRLRKYRQMYSLGQPTIEGNSDAREVAVMEYGKSGMKVQQPFTVLLEHSSGHALFLTTLQRWIAGTQRWVFSLRSILVAALGHLVDEFLSFPQLNRQGMCTGIKHVAGSYISKFPALEPSDWSIPTYSGTKSYQRRRRLR